MAGKTKVVIGELIFGVTANSKQFDRDIKKIMRSANQLGRKFSDLGTTMVKVFAPLQAAIGLATASSIKFGNSISTLTGKLNDTAVAIQTLRVLSERTGASYERMAKGLQNVLQRTNQAAGGNTAYADALRDLGINMAAIVRLPVSQRLEVISRAYVQAKDQAKAYNAMTKLVGTFSTPELLQAIQKLGRDGLSPLMEQYKELGLIVDETTTQTLSSAADKVSFLGKRWETFSANVGAIVAPQIEKMVAVLAILMRKIEDLSPTTKRWIIGISTVGTVAGTALIVLGKLIPILTGMATQIATVTVRLVAMTSAWITALGPIGAVVAAVTAVGVGIAFFTGQLDDMLEGLVGTESINLIKEWRDLFLEAIEDVGKAMLNKIGRGMTGLFAGNVAFYRTWLRTGSLPKATQAKIDDQNVALGTYDDISGFREEKRIERKQRQPRKLPQVTADLFKNLGSGVMDLFSGLGDKIGIGNDAIESMLKKINDTTITQTEVLDDSIQSLKEASSPYSDALKDFAKQTLADMKSGEIGMNTRARKEAEAVIAGRATNFSSSRFQRFLATQLPEHVQKKYEGTGALSPDATRTITYAQVARMQGYEGMPAPLAGGHSADFGGSGIGGLAGKLDMIISSIDRLGMQWERSFG